MVQRRRHEENRRDNYGFVKVELLPGNVGYLKLERLQRRPRGRAHGGGRHELPRPAATPSSSTSPPTAAARRQHDPAARRATWSTDRPTSTASTSGPPTSTKQFWTLPYVPGPRLPDVPVYVLTSGRTFSAAEEFTYNLKNLERATIVGETTGGGAHPVDRHSFDFGDYQVILSLPFGRAVNPITDTNWEGTGIEPHLVCASQRGSGHGTSRRAGNAGRAVRGPRAPLPPRRGRARV